MDMTEIYQKNRSITGGFNSDYAKNNQIYQVKKSFAQSFAMSPDYEPDALVNGEKQRLLVSNNKSVVTEKKIIAYPGEKFSLGDIVECYDAHWIVTEINANNQFYCSGIMQQCNRELIWQNPETKEIISQWVTAEKPYFSNLEEDKKMSVSTREFKIQVTYNEETSIINVGKRFMIDIINDEPKTYRVTSVDSISERYDLDGEIRGFIIWNIEQDQYNPETDNKELMICDYISPSESTEANPENGIIKFNGVPMLRMGASFKMFSVDKSIFDENGYSWEIDYGTCPADCVNSEVDNNHIYISVDNDVRVQNQLLVLNLLDSDRYVIDSVNLEVIS